MLHKNILLDYVIKPNEIQISINIEWQITNDNISTCSSLIIQLLFKKHFLRSI